MEKSDLAKLAGKGLSIREISKQTGKSYTAVRYWLNVFNIKTKRCLGVNECKCLKCEEADPSKFGPGRYTRCRRCRTKDQKRMYKDYRKQAVAYKGGKCIRCGYNKCLAALDFHHRDPKKKDPNWRGMRQWCFKRIQKELDKCDLVCKNCHAEIHFGE